MNYVKLLRFVLFNWQSDESDDGQYIVVIDQREYRWLDPGSLERCAVGYPGTNVLLE